MSKENLYVEGMPESLHHKFRIRCAELNTTIRDRVVELMKQDIPIKPEVVKGSHVFHVQDLPKDVKKKFKIKCMKAHVTMSEATLLLIQEDCKA